MEKKHIQKKWTVSFIEFIKEGRKCYKVTRRLPELSVSETKIFETKEKAKRQFDEWLG